MSLYIKYFRKKDAIKVYYIGEDKKVKVKWTLPVKDKITFDDKTYLVLPEKIYIHNGVTCMFVNSSNAEPLDVLNIKYHVKTPADFKEALGTKVVQDLIAANKKKETLQFNIILLGIIVLGLGYIYYKFNNDISSLTARIEEIYRLLGGGGIE